MKTIGGYFLRGLIFVTPIGVTILLFFSLFRWIEESIHEITYAWYIILIFFVVGIILLILLGYVGSTILLKPLSKLFNNMVKRIPVVNIVYTSLSDLMNAFVGEKKKFNKPVIVQMHKDSNEHKIGFITQDSLVDLNLPDMVVVYFPHSYAISGYTSVFPKEFITKIEASGSDIMKFLVSGGVTTFEDIKKQKIKESN